MLRESSSAVQGGSFVSKKLEDSQIATLPKVAPKSFFDLILEQVIITTPGGAASASNSLDRGDLITSYFPKLEQR